MAPPWRSFVTDETRRELEIYSARYGALLDEARRDFDELADTGVMSRARELSRRTGEHFNHNELPAFFFGDLDASLVLIYLNPKHANNHAAEAERPLPAGSFASYFDGCRHYGARIYGPDSSRENRSQFDEKQVFFLEPFDLIGFVEEDGKEDRLLNLERAIDGKLQLELIPYGSSSFSGRGLTAELLRPHYERIMGAIVARPRDYVIFCGTVFGRVLSPYVDQEHSFRLTKGDGSPTKGRYRFATLRLPYKGTEIWAGLAYSWPQQGLNGALMRSYGEKVRDLYRSG